MDSAVTKAAAPTVTVKRLSRQTRRRKSRVRSTAVDSTAMRKAYRVDSASVKRTCVTTR